MAALVPLLAALEVLLLLPRVRSLVADRLPAPTSAQRALGLVPQGLLAALHLPFHFRGVCCLLLHLRFDPAPDELVWLAPPCDF